MIDLKIESNARRFDNINEIDENWITQQISGLSERKNICIRISIEEGPVNLLLSTHGCASSGGGTRLPNTNESRVFDLWNELKLDDKDFQLGKLIAFFKRVRKIIS